MLIAGRAGGPIKKPPGLKKKKKPSRLIVSLLLWQEPTSPLAGIFKETEEIVVIDNQVIQPLVLRPPMQTELISRLITILVMIEISL